MILNAGEKVAYYFAYYLLHFADETLRIIVSTEETLPLFDQDGVYVIGHKAIGRTAKSTVNRLPK